MHGAPLIETRQPAQSLEVLQVHQRGMGILSDGRCPPERLRPTTTRGVDRLERTNGHAACGHDGEPEPAVVDLDDVDAFLPAAVQRALLNGPRLIGPQAAAGCVNTPVVHVEVLGDRGEDLAHASLLAVAPRACRRPGSVGSSSRRAGAERSAQHGRMRAQVSAGRRAAIPNCQTSVAKPGNPEALGRGAVVGFYSPPSHLRTTATARCTCDTRCPSP